MQNESLLGKGAIGAMWSSVVTAVKMSSFIVTPPEKKSKNGCYLGLDQRCPTQWRSQKFGLGGAVGQFWLKILINIEIL